jgi:uncharacterized membrane protein
VGSVIATSCIEFITGLVLEKVFHHRWWDYSDLPFNIKGYVCLKFSICWGIACTFVVRLVHPLIFDFIKLIPPILGTVLLILMMGVFMVDAGITSATILKLNKRLAAMDEVAAKIHKLSDDIGEKVSDSAILVKEHADDLEAKGEVLREDLELKTAEVKLEIEEKRESIEAKEAEIKAEALSDLAEKKGAIEDKKAELKKNFENESKQVIRDVSEIHNVSVGLMRELESAEEGIKREVEQKKAELKHDMEAKATSIHDDLTTLRQKYADLLHQKNTGTKRLLRAFPNMKSKDYNKQLDQYRIHHLNFTDEKRK